MTFDKSLANNPAIVLLAKNPEEPIPDCLEILVIIQGTQPNLTYAPVPTKYADVYTDDSSFIQEGTRYVGVEVVTGQKEALPRGASMQRVEIIALTQVLRWAK